MNFVQFSQLAPARGVPVQVSDPLCRRRLSLSFEWVVVIKWIATAFLLVLGLVGYWFFVSFLLGSNRGFEFTDEGLYLLVAREIGGSTQWSFPWGWHTAPLYHLVGGQVAEFRTIGGFILSLSAGLLGLTSYFVIRPEQRFRDAIANLRAGVVPAMFFLTGAATSFFYYAALLRAPSYNWVTLEGLLVAATGGLLLFKASTNGNALVSPRVHGASSLLGLGLIYSSAGKPTAPVMFLVMMFFALWWARGVSFAWKSMVLSVAYSGAIVATLVGVGLWPEDFFGYFLHAATGVSLSGTGIVAASRDFLGVPGNFFLSLGAMGWVSLGLLVGATLLWAFSFVDASNRKRVWGVSAFLYVIAVFWWFPLEKWIYGDSRPTYFWVNPSITTTMLLLVFLGLGFYITNSARFPALVGTPLAKAQVSVVLLLVAVPFVFGFGSGHGAYRQASLAAIGFALAAMVALVSSATSGVLTKTVAGATLLVVLAGLVLVDSHREPYRMNELGQQTEAIAIRDFGNSQLLVDSGNRDRLTEIFTLMDQSDFVPETPLIGLTWRWNAAIPYALGARVPSSAMVTLFGYPGSLQLADENLNRQGDDFPWDEAWLMVDEPPSLEPERVGMVQEVIELLELRSGLSFPSDYIFVGVADDIQVYRPDF